MKRLTLTASLVLAGVVPGIQARQSHKQPRPHHKRWLSHHQAVAYGRAYEHVVKVFGPRAAGCKLIGPRSTCSGRMTRTRVLASTDVLHRMFGGAPSVATSTSSYVSYSSGGGGYSDVPGVPSSFAACVAMRESTDGAGSSNIYGIEGPGGQGSLAEQKQAFQQMYASRGAEPWSPYDGC